MSIKKNAFCILLINSTETTPQPTLAGSNQFVVEHTCISCNAIGHARTMVWLRFFGEQSGEVHQKMGLSFTVDSGFFAQILPLMYSVPV